jgi:hypothetical protein
VTRSKWIAVGCRPGPGLGIERTLAISTTTTAQTELPQVPSPLGQQSRATLRHAGGDPGSDSSLDGARDS